MSYINGQNKDAIKVVEATFAKNGFEVTHIKNSIFSAKRDNANYNLFIRSLTYGSKSTYTYYAKDQLELDNNNYFVLVLYIENEPKIYVIPSTIWVVPDLPFVSNDYDDANSEPEWGIYVNEKHFGRLEDFACEKVIKTL